MKISSSAASVIFSLRTFAAAMLALYLSYHLDLTRPTWAFITTYIVSAPLRGAGRAKGIYRILGTIGGAAFTVFIIPNLVDAPELLVLTLALWVAGCLYLSILDGTPRAYAFILAGYSTAIIGFPTVNEPQTIFATALSRTEEIGVAIACVELMSYLPFNRLAGDALQTKIDQCLLEMRMLAIHLMTFNPQVLSIADRARLMIDVANMDTLRIHAHYDTMHFSLIEGWVVRLQRHLRDFFADLITFEAQLQQAQATPQILKLLHPITDAILAWIAGGEIEVPDNVQALFTNAATDPAQQELTQSGILPTLSDIVQRRSECLRLRQKIFSREKMDQPYTTIAHYTDYRQAAFYGLAIVLAMTAGCSFWIATGWTEGSIMMMLGTSICCIFASLDTPPTIAIAFLATTMIGSLIGWFYTFLIFPYIDGFPLLVYALAWSCIPIGIAMANPSLTGLMIPVVLGINLANLQNRFEADATGFLNNFIAQSIGIVGAGAILSFVRTLSLEHSTKRLLTENGHALALLANVEKNVRDDVVDRMAHQSALAIIRAPHLGGEHDRVVSRVLLDLQAGRALIQIKDLAPKMSPDLQQALHAIRDKLVLHFSQREGLKEAPLSVKSEIRALKQAIDRGTRTQDSLRLMGLMETLRRGIGEAAA